MSSKPYDSKGRKRKRRPRSQQMASCSRSGWLELKEAEAGGVHRRKRPVGSMELLFFMGPLPGRARGAVPSLIE
jgi:hypothetical protein